MTWKLEFDQFIKEEFQSRKAADAKFSLRAFAKQIKISATCLSQMLRGTGKWNLTPERAATIVKLVNPSESKKARLLTLIGNPGERIRRDIKADEFRVISDLAYSSVYACYDLPPPQRTIENISRRLNLSTKKVKEISEFLLEKGYIKKNPATGIMESDPTIWNIGDGPPDFIVRNHNKRSLELGAELMESFPPTDRYCSTISFAGSKSQIESLQSEMRAFSEKVMNLMDSEENNDEIYRFSICLVPSRVPTEDLN